MTEKIKYTTLDGVEIVGEWQTAPTVLGAVILLHMMPADRTSWKDLQIELSKKSLASLAIDLRGHGESNRAADGSVLDYRKFNDEEHQLKILDLIGAIAWIKNRGIDLDRIALCGASLGANLAVKMLIDEPRIAGAVLLSPGANYHGFKPLSDAPYLQTDQKLFIVSSEDDRESFASSRQLFEASPIQDKIFVPYQNAGHGTEICQADAGLLVKIADWLARIIHSKTS